MNTPHTDALVSEIIRICEDPCHWAEDNRPMGPGLYTGLRAPFSSLLSPASIGSKALRNRCVIAPIKTEADPLALDETKRRFYLDRAASGIALMTTPPIPCSSSADAHKAQRWLPLNERLHSLGAVMLLQLALDGADARTAMLLASLVPCSGFDGLCLSGRESDENALSLVLALRRRFGAGMPIVYRFSLSDASAESGVSPSSKKAPRTVDRQLSLLTALASAGVDAFEITLGGPDTPWLLHPSMRMPAGCYAEAARSVKAHFRALGMDKAVIAFGNLGYPDLCDRLIDSGDCDLVSLDGAGVTDPAWCKKVRTGRAEDILPSPVSLPLRDVPGDKIGVVGAGLRGLSFAVSSAEKGCSVELFDMAESADPCLSALSPKDAYERKNAVNYLLRRAGEQPRLKLHLHTYADAELIARSGCDAVVFAQRPSCILTPDVPRWGTIPALFADRISALELSSCRGKRVVLFGHDERAADIALYLLRRSSVRSLQIVTVQSRLFPEMDAADRAWLHHLLERRGVRIHTGYRLGELRPGLIHLRPLAKGPVKRLCCDSLILAEESPAPLRLYQELSSGEIKTLLL